MLFLGKSTSSVGGVFLLHAASTSLVVQNGDEIFDTDENTRFADHLVLHAQADGDKKRIGHQHQQEDQGRGDHRIAQAVFVFQQRPETL